VAPNPGSLAARACRGAEGVRGESARARRLVWLRPGTKEELDAALAGRGRRRAEGTRVRRPYYLFVKGLAVYRLGRWDDAVVMSGEAANTSYLGPCPRLVTAMALHRKGKTDEARKTLEAP
jgi:hypothetical protein